MVAWWAHLHPRHDEWVVLCNDEWRFAKVVDEPCYNTTYLQYYGFQLYFNLSCEGRRLTTTRETSTQSRAKVNQVDAVTSNQCDDVLTPPFRAKACFTNPFHFVVSFIAVLDTSSLMWRINWAKDLPMRVSLRITRSIFSTSLRCWLIGCRPRSKWAERQEQNFFYHLNFCEGENEIGASFRFHSICNRIKEPWSNLGRI